MALADIFNFSSLIILGILLLVVSLLVLYFENKMREQNHKIASMLSLVSSLAEEVNGVKFGINHLVMRGGANLEEQNFIPNFDNNFDNENNTKLVIVSDDEDDEDEVTIDEEELESDTSGSEVDDDDSEEDEDDNDDESNLEDIKVLKLNIGNQINTSELNSVSSEEENLELDEMDILEDLEEGDIESLDDVQSLCSSKSTVVANSPLNNTPTNQTVLESVLEPEQLDISSSDLKTININLDEPVESVDYKKFSLQKLKSVVVEKGLVSDASKLKKNELLKLLGAE